MYKTTPCALSAFQYDGDRINSKGERYVPRWAIEALNEGVLSYKGEGDLYLKTTTSQEDVHVQEGNYLALLPNGQIITMEQQAFELLFEGWDDL